MRHSFIQHAFEGLTCLALYKPLNLKVRPKQFIPTFGSPVKTVFPLWLGFTVPYPTPRLSFEYAFLICNVQSVKTSERIVTGQEESLLSVARRLQTAQGHILCLVVLSLNRLMKLCPLKPSPTTPYIFISLLLWSWAQITCYFAPKTLFQTQKSTWYEADTEQTLWIWFLCRWCFVVKWSYQAELSLVLCCVSWGCHLARSPNPSHSVLPSDSQRFPLVYPFRLLPLSETALG